MASLSAHGSPALLVPLKTAGDIDLVSPIYAMGITGVFTRELDAALLSHAADIAVHSLKDVPTVLPAGLRIAAVLERASPADVLVYKPGFVAEAASAAVIATSSIRRRSQWLGRFPGHTMVNVRGNVETRLQKFEAHNWDGIIFAKAGLERLGLLPANHIEVDWMLPAPAQGTIAVVCRSDDEAAYNACRKISHARTEITSSAERDFLFHLEGGCSVPISAFAEIVNEELHLTGAVHSIDGTREMRVSVVHALGSRYDAGESAAAAIKSSAKGRDILKEFRELNRSGVSQ